MHSMRPVCPVKGCDKYPYSNNGRIVFYCIDHLRCGKTYTKSEGPCKGCMVCYRDRDMSFGEDYSNSFSKGKYNGNLDPNDPNNGLQVEI